MKLQIGMSFKMNQSDVCLSLQNGINSDCYKWMY